MGMTNASWILISNINILGNRPLCTYRLADKRNATCFVIL